jgi:hypothetical protein
MRMKMMMKMGGNETLIMRYDYRYDEDGHYLMKMRMRMIMKDNGDGRLGNGHWAAIRRHS